MKPLFRNVLAVVGGVLVGGTLNMALVLAGPHIIAPPAGADVTTMEGLKASLHLFGPQHFVFPFLAHALGTLAGAAVAARLAASRAMLLALIIGALYLAGGVANTLTLPGPTWFNALDNIVAYLPMAWLGATFAMRRR